MEKLYRVEVHLKTGRIFVEKVDPLGKALGISPIFKEDGNSYSMVVKKKHREAAKLLVIQHALRKETEKLTDQTNLVSRLKFALGKVWP